MLCVKDGCGFIPSVPVSQPHRTTGSVVTQDEKDCVYCRSTGAANEKHASGGSHARFSAGRSGGVRATRETSTRPRGRDAYLQRVDGYSTKEKRRALTGQNSWSRATQPVTSFTSPSKHSQTVPKLFEVRAT